jgi:hypothetical protein
MWDKVTSSDIEQAKHRVNLRRAETLSRHAEELKDLVTEQTEVDELADAIAAFVSKFDKGAASSGEPAASAEETLAKKPVENENPDTGRQRALGSYGIMNFKAFG